LKCHACVNGFVSLCPHIFFSMTNQPYGVRQ
jgi:hypothetical protein